MIGNKPLKLSFASQPSDIHWFNMIVDDNVRLKSIFQSFLVLTMTLTLAFVAVVGLQLLQLHH